MNSICPIYMVGGGPLKRYSCFWAITCISVPYLYGNFTYNTCFIKVILIDYTHCKSFV